MAISEDDPLKRAPESPADMAAVAEAFFDAFDRPRGGFTPGGQPIDERRAALDEYFETFEGRK